MNRRAALKTVLLALLPMRSVAAPAVSTVIGNGARGYSEHQVNNPYGVIRRGAGLYFCDLDNQAIRRLDLKTRQTTTIAGNGQRGYGGDGGPATAASLNMPHEVAFDADGHLYIAERDNHVVRRVDAKSGVISTFAGTGVAGFSGDGGPATQAQLRQPHSIVITADGVLLICDIGNHRIRAVPLATGVIETYGGTGARALPPDGANVKGAPLNGPRTMVIGHDGVLFLALREGNAIYAIAKSGALQHLAGTGEQGYMGDGGPARDAKLAGPKGLAYGAGRLFIADTESHVIRSVDIKSGIIQTVLGTGARGDGPEPDPLRCALARPHGIYYDAGTLYVADSEAHRIRALTF